MLGDEHLSSARAVRLLALDVDGVLTDGRLLYGPDGESLKAFHARDGLGLKLLRDAGIEVAIISGRRSPPLERRLAELGIEHVFLGREDKTRALDALLEATGLEASAVAYAGDDLPDVPVLARVGLPITVADATDEAKAAAVWITDKPGGTGAVREICDALLDAQGARERVIADYLARNGG